MLVLEIIESFMYMYYICITNKSSNIKYDLPIHFDMKMFLFFYSLTPIAKKMGFLDQLKKSCVFLLVVVMSYVFFMSGFIACFFMLLAYIFIWPVNRTAYRKAVNNLAYLHWSRKYIQLLYAVTM